MLALLEELVMHAKEFVLIPRRMFVSKQPNRTETLDNPIYKQKAAQLSLLQRYNPTDFESKEGTEQETNKTNIVNKSKRRRTSSVELMSRRVEKANPSVLHVNLSPHLTVRNCIAINNKMIRTFLKEGKIDSRGQNILRKQQILCNAAEIETLKKYLSLLEYF